MNIKTSLAALALAVVVAGCPQKTAKPPIEQLDPPVPTQPAPAPIPQTPVPGTPTAPEPTKPSEPPVVVAPKPEPIPEPKPETPKPPEVVVTPPVVTPPVVEPAKPLPTLPKNAYALMPVVIQAIDDIWPDMPMRSYFPAQIEAESCITLTHSKCWNPRAELKTSREYGFGLGQITIAYRADGSERFNVFEEVRLQHPDLRSWQWEDRYNPLMQIKAIVVKNRVNWGQIKWATADLDNKMAFLATFYNGGNPSKDRNLCVNAAGCDPSKWWGNVERYSVKSKTPLKEYGNRSLFQISREYPVKVLRDRRPKYIPYVEPNQP